MKLEIPTQSTSHTAPILNWQLLQSKMSEMKNPASIFICWYTDQVVASYEAFKKITKKLDKKDKNAFSKLKCIIGGMIKYAGKTPDPRSTEDCGIEELTLWEQSVADIANLAVENAKAQLGKSIITRNDFKNK